MNSTTIIIPTRLDAKRFPNKPLKLINGKEINVVVNGFINDGDLRVIEGMGLPAMRGNGFGDLVIKFNVKNSHSEKNLRF